MKKGNFLIMMLALTVASYAQQLTLTVDLCDANPAEVRMTGPWWGWDPMGGPSCGRQRRWNLDDHT